MSDLHTLLTRVARKHPPTTYLEIGARGGLSLRATLAGHPGLSKACLISNSSQPTSQLPSQDLLSLARQEVGDPPSGLKIEVLTGDTVPGFFSLMNSRFSMVVVDADHSFQGAAGDLLLAWYLLEKGGVLVFDDISNPQQAHLMLVWTLFINAVSGRIFDIEDGKNTGAVAALKT